MNLAPLRSVLRSALCLFVFLLAGAAGAAPPPEALAAARLDAAWRASGAPGMSLAVALGGRIVVSEGRGVANLNHLIPAAGNTVYNLGSISKLNTAVAVMQLVEQGKVSLDDPILKYVPSFPEKSGSITVRHLLTHTSGIRHYRATDFPESGGDENRRAFTSLAEAIKFFRDDPLLFPPGTLFRYTSYGVNLLQGVVETASGLSFEDYLRREVWGPAGMLSTTVDVPGRIVPHRAQGYLTDGGVVREHPYGDLTYKFASGGILSTAEDQARLAAALNAGRLLRPETRDRMFASQLPLPIHSYQENAPPQEEDFEQGFLWRARRDAAGRRLVYHCGTVQGFQGCLVDFPAEDLVVVLLANGADAPGWAEPLAIAQLFLPAPSSRPAAVP
ncbi:MAG TPA: serine hydrolase domain-containing protein [Thermoanaerobaculia bacterium]|nr:serine hydrolase domain-containing protein [Thermoanaerobaculia bacterium]